MANIDDKKVPVGSKETPIPNRLHDVSEDHVVTGANEVFDDGFGERQSQINAKLKHYTRLAHHRIDAEEETRGHNDDLLNNEINAKQLEIGAVETDIEPILESPNMLPSGAVAFNLGWYRGNNNPEWVYVIMDGARRILAGIRKDGSFDWMYGVPTPIKEYIENVVGEFDTRLDALERNCLSLTLVVSPNKVFYKDVAETINLTAALGDIDPEVMIIRKGGSKINAGNNKTAVWGLALTDSINVFSAYAEYYDAKFLREITIQSRYPVYTLFAAMDADVSSLIGSATRESARVSAVGTYIFTNNVVAGGAPYLLVPSDVTLPSRFSMGGAPVAAVTSQVTIGSVQYTVYRLGSDSGYPLGVTLNIVAS